MRNSRLQVPLFSALLLLSPPLLASPLYTQTAMQRTMNSDLTARVPGLPDALDARTRSSTDLGPVSDTFTSPAVLSHPTGNASASFVGVASQSLAFNPASITGRVTSQTTADLTNAQGGGFVRSYFTFEFQLWGQSNLPCTLTGRLVGAYDSVFEDARETQADFVVLDLDTPEPEGGPSSILGAGIGSDAPFTYPLEGSVLLLAGHNYRINAYTLAGRELLANPLVPGTIQRTAYAEVSFTLSLPEPASLSLCSLSFLLLLRPRR